MSRGTRRAQLDKYLTKMPRLPEGDADDTTYSGAEVNALLEQAATRAYESGANSAAADVRRTYEARLTEVAQAAIDSTLRRVGIEPPPMPMPTPNPSTEDSQ